MELKEVGGDGGVTGAAMDVKTAVVRVALLKLPDGAHGWTRSW